MSWFVSYVRSSVGAKHVMAVTGLGLLLFAIIHMLGHLGMFAGRDAYNHYAHTLQGLGALKWIARGGLLFLVAVHIGAGVRLASLNRAARPVKYAVYRTVRTRPWAKWMPWTGLLILAFIVYHLAQLTWGVKATRIEIKDIVPPRDLVESMGRQMKAEREKRANILEAEGLRQAEILRAEGRKQSVVLDAEGRKEAAFRDAEARERSAQAEAEATRMVSEAIASGDLAALNYFVAEKYVRALDGFAKAPNQKTFILPMDLAGIAGSIGGIAEIAKSALGESATDDSRRQRAVPGQQAQAQARPASRPSAPPPSGPWGGNPPTGV